MTQAEFERLTSVNPHETQFGAVTEIRLWREIRLLYSFDGLEPAAFGRKELLTVTTEEGQLPDAKLPESLGEGVVSSETIRGFASWPAFEAELKAALEADWAAREASRAAETQPPPEAQE